MKLHEKLIKYKKNNKYSLHMPGHKNMPYYFDIDFTEVEGLDDLHNPKEDILELMNELSRIYGSKKTFISTNGSTAGILAAVSAVSELHKKILVGRQVHKSVHNAIYINKMQPFFVYPKIDKNSIAIGYDYEEIEKLLLKNDIHVMIFTTPTYEGVILDKKKLKEIAKKCEAILILDEAHGAHIFDENLADISIMSLHKTLPAMTSTAVIHCNNEELEYYLNQYMSIYVTSSPSYVLMNSISECVEFINNNKQKFDYSHKRITLAREKLKKLRYLKLFNSDDEYRIVITTSFCNINAKELSEMLDRQGFVVEMNTDNYIVAITTVMDDWDKIDEFCDILLKIDNKLHYKNKEYNFDFRKLKYEKINSLNSIIVDIDDAKDRISNELIYLYPPGVALVSRGEVFNEEIIKDIKYYNKMGLLDKKKVRIVK